MPRKDEQTNTIDVEIEALKKRQLSQVQVMEKEHKYTRDFLETTNKLAHLYLQKNDLHNAAKEFELFIDTYLPYDLRHNPEDRLFAKADMFRQLGFYEKSKNIYIQIRDNHAAIAMSSIVAHTNTTMQKIQKAMGADVTVATVVEHKMRYKSALKGLGNVYVSMDTTNPDQDCYLRAEEYYLEASKILNNKGYDIEWDLDGELHEKNNGFLYIFWQYNNSMDYPTVLALTQINEKKGNIEQAITLYKSVIENDLFDFKSRPTRYAAMKLAAIYEDSGNLELAQKYYSMATRSFYSSHKDHFDSKAFNYELIKSLIKYLSLLQSVKYKNLHHNGSIAKKAYKDAISHIRFIAQNEDDVAPATKITWLESIIPMDKIGIIAIANLIEIHIQNNNIKLATELLKKAEKLLPSLTELEKDAIIMTLATQATELKVNTEAWLSYAKKQQKNWIAHHDIVKLVHLGALQLKNKHINEAKKTYKIAVNKFTNDLTPQSQKINIYNKLHTNIFEMQFENVLSPLTAEIYFIKICKAMIKNSENNTDKFMLDLAKHLEKIEHNPEFIDILSKDLVLAKELHDSLYWYKQAATLDNEEAYIKYGELLEAKLSKSSGDAPNRLASVLSDPFTMNLIQNPISIRSYANGRYVANTYEKTPGLSKQLIQYKDNGDPAWYHRLNRHIRGKTEGRFQIVDPINMKAVSPPISVPTDINGRWSSWESQNQAIADYTMPNKIIENLIEYIMRSEDPVDISKFPGFINPATGKRFIELHLTKTGDSVEKDHPEAYCVNTMALAVMQEFPNTAKEYLDDAKEYLKNGDLESSFMYTLKALKQADIEKLSQVKHAAMQLLTQKDTTKPQKGMVGMQFSSKSDLPASEIIEKLLKSILKKEDYAKLNRIIMDPVTLSITLQPVAIQQTGNTYEAEELRKQFKILPIDPISREALGKQDVIPNIAIAKVVPWILAQHKLGKNIDLSRLPIFFNTEGKPFVNPYLTKDGETVEKGAPGAICENWMLKKLIKEFTPQNHAKLKL